MRMLIDNFCSRKVIQICMKLCNSTTQMIVSLSYVMNFHISNKVFEHSDSKTTKWLWEKKFNDSDKRKKIEHEFCFTEHCTLSIDSVWIYVSHYHIDNSESTQQHLVCICI